MLHRATRPPGTLFRRFFLSIALAVILFAGASIWFTSRTISSAYTEITRRNLITTASIASAGLPELLGDPARLADRMKTLARAGEQLRVTVISPAGAVLADTGLPSAAPENHRNRSEVAEVLAGAPFATREGYSATLRQHLYYLAIPVKNPNTGELIAVCRVSYPINTLFLAREKLANAVFIITGVSFLLILLLCMALTRSVSNPLREIVRAATGIAEGDLTVRLGSTGILELDRIAARFNAMAVALGDQMNALRREHTHLSTLLDTLSAGVLLISPGNRILHANAAVRAWFAFPPGGEAEPPLAARIRHGAVANLLALIRAAGSVQECEFTIESESGEEARHILLRGKPALGDALLILTDITRLKYLETLRRDFAANVSHELRTPVTAILGFVETLQNGAIDDPACARRFLSIIHAHTLRLGNVISDILSLTRIERESEGGAAPLPPVPLHPMLAQTLEMWEPIAAEKDITLALAEAAPAAILPLNEGLFLQALGNLVSNAITYSPAGSTIRLSVEDDGNSIAVSVADSGIGIDPAHHGRIFERFYTVDKNRSRANGGTGLGLAIVKHIMNLHAGSVSVTSEPGKGSTFTLRFPRAYFD